MKLADTRLKKTLLVTVITLIITIALVIIFISPITKYLVEKYDEEYTGRRIKIDWAYVNPFTGYVYLSNLTIYEAGSDSLFLTAHSASANFAMLKMLKGTYEISELTLNTPRGFIIQDKKDLNIDDLIVRFSKKKKPGSTSSKTHFNLLGIKINNGEFHYREKVIPINYFIKNVTIESTGFRWDSDSITADYSFLAGIGNGDAKGNFMIDYDNLNYRLDAVIHKYDLKFIEQYLKDLINYGSFKANIDADIKANGNFKEGEDLTAKGLFAINDFHFGKNPEEDFSSFDKFVLDIGELSPKNHKYIIDSISLQHPFLKYEMYDYLDNVQHIFGKNGENVKIANSNPERFNLVLEIAKYVVILAKNFLQSDYKINRVAIYNGDFQFRDYSLSEKFSIAANPLFLIADSVSKNQKRVDALLWSGIKPYGDLVFKLSIDPNDTGDFDIKYGLNKLPASLFNPYTITYTSYPLDRGTLELKGTWNVREGKIQSENHLLVIDPRLGRRIKNEDMNRIPAPLIMAFIRERGNVIDYQIPITGNLRDPKLHIGDIITDLLENILIKPPTLPYRTTVKSIEKEIEKSLTFKWFMRQNYLSNSQEKFAEKISDFLKENPEASIGVYLKQYDEKEKEHILFFEAKKKYYLLTLKNINAQNFSEDDSLKVEKTSVKDPLLVKYLDKLLNDSMLYTIQEKCIKFVGAEFVNEKFNQLNTERESAFLFYFKEKGVESRVKMNAAENKIPYNGFSFYRIDYKGELPKSLLKAYRQMDELNEETPRKKMQKEREKNKPVI